MAKIIAGRFETQEAADRALAAFASAGLEPGQFTSFYLGPPGHHDKFPLGGDAHHDEGTREAGAGAGTTAAAGGAAGLAVGMLAAVGAEPGLAAAGAIAGAGVGAYVGSLAGALGGSHAGNPARGDSDEPVGRHAGIMVAINMDGAAPANNAVDMLRAAGAVEIEESQGSWAAGTWEDFDTRQPTRLIYRSGELVGSSRAGSSGQAA